MKVSWEFTDTKVTRDEIINASQYWNVSFPEDYLSIACENHGGWPTPNTFDFDDHDEAVFGYLLSFNPSRSHYIISTFENVNDRLPQGIVPIADDPFGNLICFDFRKNSTNPSVVFWDHELAFSNPEEAISFISWTFTELLDKLYE